VREVEIFQFQNKAALALVFSDFRLALYESILDFKTQKDEVFRFKMVRHSKLIFKPEDPAIYSNLKLLHRFSDKSLVVLHPQRPFYIFERKGRFLFHNV